MAEFLHAGWAPCDTFEIMRIWRNQAMKRARSVPAETGAPDVVDVLRSAAERLDAVAAEARAAAEGIRADGNAMIASGRGSASRRAVAAGVAGSLADRAAQLQADADELRALLDRSARLLVANGHAPEAGGNVLPMPAAPSAPPAVTAVPDRGDEPDANGAGPSDRAPRPPATRPEISEGVRLLATQMAVAGSTHDEIEGMLRRQFGVQGAEGILDQVLGPRAVA